MNVGSIVKFTDWNDLYLGKLGIVTIINPGYKRDAWDICIYIPGVNCKTWRSVANLEVIK